MRLTVGTAWRDSCSDLQNQSKAAESDLKAEKTCEDYLRPLMKAFSVRQVARFHLIADIHHDAGPPVFSFDWSIEIVLSSCVPEPTR